VQPSVSCTTSSRRFSAFWVGIGGFTRTSRSLEQIGTEADCAGGRTSSYAWYELVPAGEVTLKLAVQPGDHMAASVSVRGHAVVLHLRDLTSGESFARVAHMDSPDTSSAEWIAEAPSVCASGDERCETLPLADFSPATFAGATAALRGGSARPIDAPTFHVTQITLRSRNGGSGRFGRAMVGNSAALATPGALAGSGSEFTVGWEQATTPTPPSPPSEPGFSEPPGLESARATRALSTPNRAR
jgi:hypothetical protein